MTERKAASAAKTKRTRRKADDGRVSLHPLTFEQALDGLLKVPVPVTETTEGEGGDGSDVG